MEIYFVTPHGRYRINVINNEQSLLEICWVNRIPVHSVTFYGVADGDTAIIVGKHEPLKKFEDLFQSILIRPDRNIDYWSVCQKDIKHRPAPNAVAEYSFPSEKAQELLHFEFSETQCKEYVLKRVSSFFENDVVLDPVSKIVIGISGGGDSNTLIEAFLNSGKVKEDQIIAVMMLGIPDWDKGRSRAEAICKQHQIELRFVDSHAVNKLLGRDGESTWLEDFEKVFPDSDLEVLGTLGVRLSLIEVARSIGAQSIVTGLNMEDILAECLLTTMQGKLPSSFPVRIIDGMQLWYPLYNIPKKILDGCYPKYSLANYEDRFPSKMLARANVYYLAQMLNSLIAGVEFDLLQGFKDLAKKNTDKGFFDPKLGFSVVEKLPREVQNRWMMFTQM
jgi:tRNA(Ile)-lysidine synthase TilS/MesJ